MKVSILLTLATVCVVFQTALGMYQPQGQDSVPEMAGPPPIHTHVHNQVHAYTSHSKFHRPIERFPAVGNYYNIVVPHLNQPRRSPTKTFYDQCGTTIRRCNWMHPSPTSYPPNAPYPVPQKRTMNTMMVPQPSVSPGQTTPLEQFCTSTKHVCVGNTVTCISERNCDVAMNIIEISTEGKPEAVSHSVSYLNNCELDPMTVSDSSRLPQMFFGIGFATYDENGKNLECRKVKTEDFKLVFLWKNATTDGISDDRRICRNASETVQNPVVNYAHELMTSVYNWPQVCNSVKEEEGEFNLKSFLTKHVPISKFSTYFSPPFDFADNLPTEAKENGMLITGTVE